MEVFMSEENKWTRRAFLGALPAGTAAAGGALGWLTAFPDTERALHEASRIPNLAREEVVNRAKEKSMTPEEVIDAYTQKIAELTKARIPTTDDEQYDQRMNAAVGLGVAGALSGLLMLNDRRNAQLDSEAWAKRRAESDARIDAAIKERERTPPSGGLAR
jgi:hypothetical protein